MLLNSLLLSISSSIDSLGIGITYGIKNTKISCIAKVIIFLFSLIATIISIWFGNVIKSVFPSFLTKSIGNCILIFMGLFMCFQALNKNDKNKFKIENNNTEKIYSFFIKFLGVTINIIKNPVSSDLDNSKLIDSKEALFLGVASSLDSFCIGIGGSIIGISYNFFPFFVAVFQLLFLNFGIFLGKKIHNFTNLPDNVWSVCSGVLLLAIGVCKFFV